MNKIGTKRNSRVNSQGYTEQAIAAIEAANGAQKKDDLADKPSESSPDGKSSRRGLESPTKLKLTLKGFQKIQKHRDEMSDHPLSRSIRQSKENSVTSMINP